MLDYMLDDEKIISSKKQKKKTLSDLLDKYGSVENIDKNADVRDSYDYMFANTGYLIDEVLAERNASSDQNQLETDDDFDEIKTEKVEDESDIFDDEDYADVPKKEDGKPYFIWEKDLRMDDLDIPYRQREEIRKLSVLDQYKAIKKLRKETEKANENLGEQYAKNDYAGVHNDANCSIDSKDKMDIDYSKYGKGFSKEFIDELVSE